MGRCRRGEAVLLRLVRWRPSMSRMLDFLGIGAQKAATTWLYLQLRRHPELEFPAGKEVHFWDRRDGRPPEEWLALFETSSGEKRAGEITPAYAFLDRATVREIRACRPELRLFYCVRDPIERAWSAALMALERAEMQLEEASDRWFLDHFHSAGSLARGDHLACLECWGSVFPAEQLKLVFYDDLVSDPGSVLEELADHLEVDGRFFGSLADAELREPVHVGIESAIRPSLLPALHRLYDEKIAALADRLGRDLGHWLEPRREVRVLGADQSA